MPNVDNFLALTSLNRHFVETLTRPAAGGRNQPLPIPKAGYISTIGLVIRGTVGTGVATAPTPNPGHAGIISRMFLNTNIVGRLVDITGFGYHSLYRRYMDSGYIDGLANLANFDGDTAIAVGAFDISMIIPLSLTPLSTRGLFMNQSDKRNVTLTLEWETVANLDVNATPTLAFTGSPTCEVYWEFFDAPEGVDNQPPQDEIHQIVEAPLQVQSAAGVVVYEPELDGWFLRIHHGYNNGVGVTTDVITNVELEIGTSLRPYDMSLNGWTLFHHRYHPTRAVSTVIVDYAAYSGLGLFGVGRDWFPAFDYANYKHRLTVTAAGNLRSIVDKLYRRVAPAR